MAKADLYRQILPTLDDWDAYVLENSNLPGPRSNLELLHVVADLGDERRFRHFLTFTPDLAPTNTPGEFLACCGVVGLGRLAAEGRNELFPELRALAADPRWRVREGVAMGLHRVGMVDMKRLLTELAGWVNDSWLVQRAVVAGVAEPALLRRKENVAGALLLLDATTAHITTAVDRRDDNFRTLRQALGYAWSVVVVADPIAGKAAIERWFAVATDDADIRWILRENLKKRRLTAMDAT
ncbi:MAG: hypothetical protein IPK16_18605 [Anaerolineales bacterium]|nr:hypothetical protein [Anaerolineales bacterium]